MSHTYGRRGEDEEGRRRESENEKEKREGRMTMFYLNILMKH